MSQDASARASEAWEQRFKHVRAANHWIAIAHEKPEDAEVCNALAAWMDAYADADAAAEKAFGDIAARREQEDAPHACPGCHTIAGPCAPRCVDAEIAAQHEHDRDHSDADEPERRP